LPIKIKAETGTETGLIYLKNLLSIPLSENIELSESLSIINEVNTFELASSYEQAVIKRPEIKLLELQSKATDQIIDAEYSGHIPSVALFGQYKAELQANDFKVTKYNWPNSSYVGLNINIPIFSGFKTSSKVEQAEIEKQKVETQLSNAKQMISTEVKVSISNLQQIQKSLEVQKQTIGYAERSYQLVSSKFSKGLLKLSDIQDAELLLNQAKTNYLQEVYNYLVALVEYDKVMGSAGR